MIIPQKVRTYKNGSGKNSLREVKTLKYKTPQGWIDVLVWHRYPSYDFIFGVPMADHLLYKEEAVLVEYRDVRQKKVHNGFYLDWGEMMVWGRGFDQLRKHWQSRKKPK